MNTPRGVETDEESLGTLPTLPKSTPNLPLLPEVHGIQPPPSLPNYEVFEELGHGGMGVVYRARQRSSGTIVALKVLRKERVGHAALIKRFRREALAVARLTHPHIVHLVEADLEGATPYLAMEFVAGIDLQTLVDRHGPLPIAQACDFVRQAAVALQHAHEQGMVHRDIKPSNLMVVAPNGLPLPARPVIKILDMGVARLYHTPDNDTPLTTLTRDGSMIGTLDFMAPEQLEDPRSVDIRADLYSLGCTFYFLLTGQVPFPGGSVFQKADWQRWKVAVSPDQLRREVGSAVAALVRKLMQKDRDDRFQTPGDLAQALESLLRTGQLPGTHQPAAPRMLRSFRNPTGPLTNLAFDASGACLLGVCADHSLRVYEVESGHERLCLSGGRSEWSCLALHGSLVAVGVGVGVRVYDWTTGREVKRFSGHCDAVRSVAWSADGRQLLSGGEDKQVLVWETERGTLLQRFHNHRGPITTLRVCPDGKRALSASRDGCLLLWELLSGCQVRRFSVPRGPVLCLAWSPEIGQFASGHFDTTIRLWDLQTGQERHRFHGHKQMVSSVGFTPRGTLVSVAHDQTLRLWDIASGGEISSCVVASDRILSLALHPRGMLATATADGEIRLWNTPTGV
ncbi:MAG: serine/threonine-protein kinase [Gemmataceae bacterium]